MSTSRRLSRRARRAVLAYMAQYMQALHLVDTGETKSGRAVFALSEPFEYRQSLNGGGISVCVPAGFRTDFASIPRGLWNLFNPAGPWRRAAVIHDYLYTKAANCPRFLADAVFRHCMQMEGIGTLRRLAIYYAVRLCGAASYQRR